nr:reverse transcriptase domain-containing protein [Tanacetum cinerariifolium]
MQVKTVHYNQWIPNKKSYLGPWLRCVGPLQANYVLREIHEGSCSMHAVTGYVVAKSIRTGYYWPTMHADARKIIRECQDCQAHRTMIKSSNEDTPFSLSYGTKAVILVEIGMPTLRTAKIDMIQKNEALKINLDLLEEQKVASSNPQSKKQGKDGKILQLKVRNISFKPGGHMYRNNDANHAKDSGKLSPKWEGPYEVTEALGKGAYKLRDRKEKLLSRTWNVRNLKKCYVHEM